MVNLIPWKRKETQSNGGAIATREANPLARLREEMDALFDRFFREGPAFKGLGKDWPALREDNWSLGWGLDVDDRNNDIVVRAEAPGFDPEDFDVQISGNHLIVRAEHKQESKKKDEFSYRYGTFQRVIPLPNGIEEDKVSANYRHGVLQITVPKGERAKGKRIAIKAS
ncbi:MAG: Hsp20/alpha crystallin family protein [Pirellulales bacterium]|nr:Hsp20/alpha crystallin family protein [Pirellulales bacterium]